MSSALVTSPSSTMMLPGRSEASACNSASFSWSRAVTAPLYPSPASFNANARPIPELAPDIQAIPCSGRATKSGMAHLLRAVFQTSKQVREFLAISRFQGNITPLWLLSADQVSDELGEGAGELDRRVKNRKRDAG